MFRDMPLSKEQAARVLADAHFGIEDGLERVFIIRAGLDDPRANTSATTMAVRIAACAPSRPRARAGSLRHEQPHPVG
jgi:hypothetical protein